ncbi:MAG TPA: type VI secretion system membrane subunit TssM [Pyrinomonadaceae bacterium]|jgi:type VI secretion system protein ImpL|nr:type VI secretion system membrane subunit TssM [Pyrinomonadaceae bacterium]
MRSVLGYTGLFSLCGIASLLVVHLGPQYGVGPAYQIIMVGLILLTLPFVFVIDARRRRRERRQDEAAAEPAKSRGAAAPPRAYEDLTRGAEEAVQWLRNTKLAEAFDAADETSAVYALPWFVVAGPPASGKTSLLLSSGLNFQTLPSQRHAEHRTVRPTRGCDWRVTDAAVFLDTSGRYQIEGASGDEWAALAETLKRYRGRRALDGFIIAVSAEWAARAGEAEIEQQAKVLRAHLDDMMRRTGVRFPVYLIWTHADAVEGFREFFGRLSRAERGAEVWGATFPLEQALEGNTTGLLDVEFDSLLAALGQQRLARLNPTESPADQLAVFNFPARFGVARDALAHFTSTLFLRNPFSELPLLRGFYFTANVADGGGGGPAAPGGAGATRPAVATRTIGEGFFAERLFKEVLLRDKDLAAALQPPPRRRYHLRLALAIALAVLCAGLSAAFYVSYAGNRRLLAEARARAARVEERARLNLNRELGAQQPLEARLDIEAVEALRETVAALDENEREGPPLGLRFGLYAGGDVNPQARAAYFEAVTERYFKPALAGLEKDLRAFAANSPNASADGAAPSEEENLGRHYDLLKAYLMLTSEPARVEPTFLAAQLDPYWRAASPPDMEFVSRQQLDFYARQANRPAAPRAKADDKLVAQARARLAAYPAVNRFYKRVTTEINARTPPVTLASALGGRGGGVLSGSYTVPGSYTVEGFRQHVSPAFASASEELSRDDWVMGAAQGGDAAADMGKLWGLYFRDYTDHWRRFLRGAQVGNFRSKDDAVRALAALTATDSPMELAVEAVARNTDLSAPQAGGFFAWLKSFFSRNRAYDTGGNSEVEREFRPLIEFASAAGNKDAAAASQYRAALQQVLEPLANSSPDQLSQTGRALLTGTDDIGLQRSEQVIARLLDNFDTAAGRDAAALLKQPLGNLRAMLYGGGYEEIVKEWREQIYPVAQRLEAGYPFTGSGASSVADLARYLNPVDGQFTTFFNTRLASSFDDAQGRLKLKESNAFKFSEEFITYLNNARRLRDALFPNGGKQPEVNYDVTLQPVRDADVLLEIDGTRVESRGSSPASAKFVFPARAGGSSGVRIVVNSGGQSQERTFTGEWGLFKLLEAGGAGAPSADNSYTLRVGVGPASVGAALRPSSAVSPFDRALFTNLKAPSDVAQ